MDIAVYGAGEFGEYIIKELNKSKEKKVICKLLVDNNPLYEGKQKLNIPIVNLRDFLTTYHNKVDSVLVAVSDLLTMQEMVLSLVNENYDNVYLVSPNTLASEIPVLNKNGDFISYVVPYNECKPVLPYVEYHVSDYCNLKCKGCGHFSNIVPGKKEPSIDDFKDSLAGLSKRFKNILKIRLMGGEPFTNSNLCDFIYAAKEVFPYSDIRIATNGLLLPQIDEKTVWAIRACNACIDISQYPPTREMIEKIIEFTESKNIQIWISKKVEKFIKYIGTSENKDFKAAFENCSSNKCYFLREKRLYVCGAVKLLYENRDFLGLNISEEFVNDNSFDLVDGNESGWEILQKISFPSDACKYCSIEAEDFDWKVSGKNINREDWLVSERKHSGV